MDDKTLRFAIAAGVIGLVGYLLWKQAQAGKAPAVKRPPASAGPGQTSTLIKDINSLGGLFTSIGGLFKSSPSPTVPMSTTGTNLIQPDAAAVSSWNDVSASDLDALSAGDLAQGVEGPF